MLFAGGAFGGQMACVPYEKMKDRLETVYGEKVTVTGVDEDKNLVEFYTGDKGSWSYVVTLPNGISCLMNSGVNWKQKIKGIGV